MSQVRMRKDLAEEHLLIPAGKSYQNYDDLVDVEYFSAEDLAGAQEIDTGEDPDNHPFFTIKLKNGEVFYFMGVDLDWIKEES